MTQNTDTPRRLSPWNPLDHLRLLWWVLVTPQRLVAYRDTYGKNAEHSVSKWVASTLTWLPLVTVTLARGLGTMPRSESDLSTSAYLWISAGIVLAWVLTGWSERGYIGSAAVGVAFVVADALVGLAAGIVMLIITGVVVENIPSRLETSLETNKPSGLIQIAFGMLLLAYAFLTWFCFLGGWRIFR